MSRYPMGRCCDSFTKFSHQSFRGAFWVEWNVLFWQKAALMRLVGFLSFIPWWLSESVISPEWKRFSPFVVLGCKQNGEFRVIGPRDPSLGVDIDLSLSSILGFGGNEAPDQMREYGSLSSGRKINGKA